MNLAERLEIIIPTYNRKEYLRSTLAALTAEASPVKNCSITVLDNASTDGTSELLAKFARQFPNIKPLRNTRNIGGNANIARCFELAAKEYFWVLADDDEYDWNGWAEVEQAMQDKQALIIVNHEILPQNAQPIPANLMRLLTFVPSAIHRADTITPEALINIYYNIPTWFPQLAAVAEVFNKNLPYRMVSQNIVLCGKNTNHQGLEYHRRTEELDDPFRLAYFEVNYLKALGVLKDKKMRAAACEQFLGRKKSFFLAVQEAFKQNMIEYDHYLGNYTAPLAVLSNWQRVRFVLAILCNYLLFFLLYPKYARKRKRFLKRLQDFQNGEKV
ncbi:glycosyltransferase family 2 protein [Candidatus Avelusimicrobium sp.]|uniref:glycosyltransferase family 2 protein n=1 Tax=Candidatus Avelusimicrobium sp. TaxID=3048833 RepID=UPI003D7E5157